jgi:hypothetical protein
MQKGTGLAGQMMTMAVGWDFKLTLELPLGLQLLSVPRNRPEEALDTLVSGLDAERQSATTRNCSSGSLFCTLSLMVIVGREVVDDAVVR